MRWYSIVGWIVLGIVVVGGSIAASAVDKYIQRLQERRLHELANTAAAALEPHHVDDLAGDRGDIGRPVFEVIRSALLRVVQVNPRYRFAYLMTVRDGDVIFLADAEPPASPDYSAPGDVYHEAPPQVRQVMAGSGPRVIGPYQDRWGEWVTGLAPVVSSETGEVIAVLGLDLDADDWRQEAARYRWLIIALTVAVGGVALLPALGAHRQGRHHRRIRELNARLRERLAEIQKSQEALQLAGAVYSTTSEGIMVTDSQWRILSVNPAFERITGYSQAQVIGRDPAFLRSSRHDAEFFGSLQAELDRTGRWRGVVWSRDKSGRVYPQQTLINALPDAEGRVVRYASLFQDITAQQRLEDMLRQESATDGLTGIANRRAFDESLQREWMRARRHGFSLSMILCDIDHFKDFNDRFGHPAGDACLQAVARCLRESLHRAGDVVARYGGEEFAILLPQMDAAEAVVWAEKIRGNVEALGIAHPPPAGTGVLTISLGVAAEVPGPQSSPQSLIAQADQALYQAKAAGRNRTALAQGAAEGE
jgi:diguanylate cyclase (GGDEF)-like protein/PAS domain S-box-containing protein